MSPSNSANLLPQSRRSSAIPAQACAACKYQRRKCTPDCTLAPYFPADKQQLFLSAHRLFGVSNILKTIRGLDEVQRNAAMRNIIFQSNMRAQDPTGGCYRIILDLQAKIDAASANLDRLLQLHDMLRAQAEAATHPPILDHLPPPPPPQHHYFGGGESSSVVKNEAPEMDPSSSSSSALRLAGLDLGQNDTGQGEEDKLPPVDAFELMQHHQRAPFLDAVDREEENLKERSIYPLL